MKDKVFDVHEISVDYGGNNYLVIYGQHINGGFISIPNWNVCVEASAHSSWEDVLYNKLTLEEQAKIGKAAGTIATAIKDHYASYLKSLAAPGQGIWQHFGGSGRYVKDGEIIVTYDSMEFGQDYYISISGNSRLETVRSDDEHIAALAEKIYAEACKESSKEQAQDALDAAVVSYGRRI